MDTDCYQAANCTRTDSDEGGGAGGEFMFPAL